MTKNQPPAKFFAGGFRFECYIERLCTSGIKNGRPLVAPTGKGKKPWTEHQRKMFKNIFGKLLKGAIGGHRGGSSVRTTHGRCGQFEHSLKLINGFKLFKIGSVTGADGFFARFQTR